MSQIFDALQRSESERAGGNASGVANAAELLRNAEQQGAMKLRPLNREETRSGVAKRSANGREVTAPSSASAPVATAALLDREAESANSDADILGQFASVRVSLPEESKLVCLSAPESPAAEAFRLLGIRLNDLRQVRPLKKLLITSSIPQEGKSMVAANLACVLARTDRERILLLEGDVRRPSLSETFGIDRLPGIYECLEGKRTLVESIYRLEGAGICIMPAGRVSSNPQDLLESDRVGQLMEQLCAWFDWIVMDSPPILPLADTSVWMRLADGILLATRQGKTQKRALKSGIEALDSEKLIGAILNSSRNPEHSDYYYSSYGEPADE